MASAIEKRCMVNLAVSPATGAADCGEYRQAAGAFAQALMQGSASDGSTLAHTYRPVKVSVENRWNSSGKHVGGTKNKHGVVFVWSPRRRTRNVSACVYGPVLQILQSNKQGHFLSSHRS
jgi:hypothetical protein